MNYIIFDLEWNQGVASKENKDSRKLISSKESIGVLYNKYFISFSSHNFFILF